MEQFIPFTGALLVLSIVLITILLITRNKLKNAIAAIHNSEELNQRLSDEVGRINNAATLMEEGYKKEVQELHRLNETYLPILDKDKVIAKKQSEINDMMGKLFELNEKYKAAYQVHKELERQIDLFQDTLELNEYGLYIPKYSFEFPEQYKVELEGVYQKQKAMVSNGTAVICNTEWEVSGSKTEGKKMTKYYMKLMLYAFNGECDGLIAKIKWNNATKTIERIKKTYESINKLGETHTSQISYDYLRLKLEELALTHEYEQKKYEEREEQRRIREMMREEERAQKEFERAQREAEDEEKRYQRALNKAKQDLQGASQSEVNELQVRIATLEKNLRDAAARKERAISLAQTTKVGHIYVISNIGSFGEHVYKIGMTRRLDPLDRVKELGDASVPFQFDVHAIIYSENAPQLENELHKKFSDRRLNRINGKKEFFRVTLDEIESFILQKTNAEIQFTKLAEAKEYRETIAMLEKLNEAPVQQKKEEVFPESLLG